MNKRLRKKKHVGEFAALGCQVIVRRKRSDGFDAFLDIFIEGAIEANGLYCGGGGQDDTLDVVVELGRPSQDPEGKLRAVTVWLDGREDVREYQTGPLIDLWYGDGQRPSCRAEMNRTERDFRERPEAERNWMLANTWCETCEEADLGMTAPREYEENNRIYVEGRCRKCGRVVRSEIVHKEAG